MDVVLILGAGRGQVGLIKAANDIGCRTVVISIEGDYPGIGIADEVITADIRDIDSVVKIAKQVRPDAIVTAGTDIALPSLGMACDACNCPGPTYEAAKLASNKARMKNAFEKGGVRTAKHIVARNHVDAENAVQQIGLPLIVKATDLEGSRGINIVFREEDIDDAFDRSMEASREAFCVIEEYIDGYEVSATALISDGKIRFILPMGDVRYGDNGEMPVGHYVPLDCDANICEDIKEQIGLAIKALNLDNCAVNADLMIKDDKVYILEMTSRLGGNAIPEITSAYYGVDIYKLIVEMALGRADIINEYDFSDRADKICYGRMMISEHDGILARDSLEDDCEATFFIGAGESVNRYSNPGDCIGQLVVVHPTKAECEEHAERALKSLMIK